MNKYISVLLLLFLLASCTEEWLSDVVPTDKLSSTDAVINIKDARNCLNGVFSNMQSRKYYGATFIVYGDLKGMDVRSNAIGNRYSTFYEFREFAEASPSQMFSLPYNCLLNINNAIVNVTDLIVDESEEDYKQELLGNFYALRALCHFDELKAFARIPTSVNDESTHLGIILADKVISIKDDLSRSDLKTSYDFVIADLKKAIATIPSGANTSGWFTLNSAKALAARVYLYRGNYQKAYDYAMQVINSGDYDLISYEGYSKAWGSTTTETILEIINTKEDHADREGIGYLWLPSAKGGYGAIVATDSFKEILASDPDDIRNTLRTHNENFVKYPDNYANNIPLIRLSEMYFIAAEATFKLNGNKNEAASLLNNILLARTNKVNVLSESDINLDRILMEKRKEFIGEGHTYFDYIRNRKDIVRVGGDHLASVPMEIKYNDNRTVQPIPRYELDVNQKIQQNPGY